MHVTQVHICYSKYLSLAVIQDELLLNHQFLYEKSMVISDIDLSYFKQNIVNKNMHYAYYLETSPSDTGLIILIVQSRDTNAELSCFLLKIANVAIG